MADNEPEKENCKVIERRCRIVVDVPIRITEITRESVAKYFTPAESEEEGITWEWAERQNRLLLMLMQDEAIFNQFLASIASSDLAMLLQIEHITGLPNEVEDQLLERVYASMESADARFFEEAKRDGILDDNIELVYRVFVTTWQEAKLTGLTVIE